MAKIYKFGGHERIFKDFSEKLMCETQQSWSNTWTRQVLPAHTGSAAPVQQSQKRSRGFYQNNSRGHMHTNT